VAEARRVEAVRAFLEREFAPTFATPEAVPDREVREAYERTRHRFVHDEIRDTVYVRVPVADDIERGSPEDRAARQLIERIHAALAHRRDLEPDDVYQVASAIAGDREVEHGPPFKFFRPRAVKEYGDAAFAVPEAGRVSAPARTDWGWDVILVTEIIPARQTSLEEAAPELRELLFEGSRRRAFLAWSAALSRDLEISVDVAALETLAEADAARAGLLGTAGAGAPGTDR
jgi:peptidyl-prolyl cis-trans isomerase D